MELHFAKRHGKRNSCLTKLLLLFILPTLNVVGASHNDSPNDIANPTTDVSDFYMFRSWQDPDNIVLAMNVFPGQNLGNTPVLSSFNDDAIYRVNIDNNMDGKADDVVYEFRFTTRIRDIPGFEKFPFPAIGHPNMIQEELRGITSLDGSGSEGLRVRQVFSVIRIKDGIHERVFESQDLFTVPTDMGPLVMPYYGSLAAKGIYTDPDTGIRIFTGARAEATYGDPSVLFSGFGLDRFPPFLTEQEDLNDHVNPFGDNTIAGKNVNSIVIEVPANQLTVDAKSIDETQVPFIGGYASVLMPKIINTHLTNNNSNNATFTNKCKPGNWQPSVNDSVLHARLSRCKSRYTQVSRTANPTLNLLMTDYLLKDKYNASAPENDHLFQDHIRFPSFANYLSQTVGLPVPPTPRLGILSILYKYPGQTLDGDTCGYPCADLLHLNIQVPPTPPEMQSRLGALLSSDFAGLPNGRRPNDDVYDITLRAFGGPAFIGSRISDGINYNDKIPGAGISDGPGYATIPNNHLDITDNGIVVEFPYLAPPHASQ